MYLLASSLKNLPILSLRNSQVVAVLDSLIINPDNLTVVAVYCQNGPWRKRSAVVMTRDIREFAREGMIIDSLEDIEDVSEIVRLKSIIDQNFILLGKEVVTESGSKLGKVEDYTIDVTSYQVQKLYIKQSLLKNLLLNNLVIDRGQIITVTTKRVVVKDASVTEKLASALVKPVTQPVPQE